MKKIGAQIKVECPAKGQGEGNGLPHAGKALAGPGRPWQALAVPDISPGTGTLKNIHLH